MMWKGQLLFWIIILNPICSFGDEVIELLKNPEFTHGFKVKGIEQDYKINRELFEGELAPGWDDGQPDWVLSQWYSKASIIKTPADFSDPAMVQWKNTYKTIAVGKPHSTMAGLYLGVDAYTEFGGVYRDGSQKDWPHLLVSQRISGNNGHLEGVAPSVGGMDSLRFRLSCKIISNNAHKTDMWHRNRHAARFRVNLTIQNLRPDKDRSKDYGRFIWFVITLYDDRHPVLTPVKPKIDRSSRMLIYNVGLKPFANDSPKVGEWNHLDADILPYIRQALEYAWSNGVLTGTRNLDDYFIGSMNIGYEVTGLNTILAQIRNPSLQAVLK